MAKTEVLETPNKLAKQVDTVEAMDMLIEQKKKELQDMSNQYGATHARLVTEQNRIANERAEFNNEVAKEKREFEELKNKKLSDLQQREDNLGKGEQNFNDRSKTLTQREIEAEKAVEERSQLFNLRVEAEKSKNHSDVELSKTLALQSEAQRKIDEASIIKDLSEKKSREIESQLLSLSTREEALRQREEDMLKRLVNLQALKDEIEPKLIELEAKKSENEKLIAEIKSREIQIDARTQDNNRIFDNAVAQSKANKAKAIELDTREREILRKEMAK